MGVLFLTRANAARATLLLGAGLSFATPVWAQNAAFDAAATNAATAPLQAALADENMPLTLSAKQLNSSWRRFKISKSLDSNFRVTPEANEEGASYSYLTRGETIKVGDETFLVAYRTRHSANADYDAIENIGAADEDYADVATNASDSNFYPPNFDENAVTPDGYLRLLSTQTLSLCLLNVRTIGDLGDIRAFDAKTDLIKVVTAADRERQNQQALAERANLSGVAVNQQVDSDLKQIGLAMLMYIQDYDEKLPPMRSVQRMADIKNEFNTGWSNAKPSKVQPLLGPYLKSVEIFAHPTTREIYRPNINVSGRTLASLDTAPEQVITFYEASPAPDGTRAVLYLDGHVKRERETDWPAIRAASDAIAPPFNAGKIIVNGNPTSATVTLYDAAAMAYMLRRGRDNKGRKQTVYLSNVTHRVYYRDAQTHQAIWLSSPMGTTANGITIPANQAQEFREFQGYNGQPFGRTFGDNSANAAFVTPKVKTALGANAALRGSQINVDTTSDNKTVVLRGTVTSNAQKTLAEAIAQKYAPGFRVVNQLVVTR